MAFMPALSKFIDFQDPKVCAKVRAIKKSQITKHPNKGVLRGLCHRHRHPHRPGT